MSTPSTQIASLPSSHSYYSRHHQPFPASSQISTSIPKRSFRSPPLQSHTQSRPSSSQLTAPFSLSLSSATRPPPPLSSSSSSSSSLSAASGQSVAADQFKSVAAVSTNTPPSINRQILRQSSRKLPPLPIHPPLQHSLQQSRQPPQLSRFARPLLPPLYPPLVHSANSLTSSASSDNSYHAANPMSGVRRTRSGRAIKPPNAKQPDWQEFYKNGLPKEVIVIDDEPSLDQPSRPPPRSKPLPAALRPAEKKRKIAASSAYDAVYNSQDSYSATQTPYYDALNSSNGAAPKYSTTAPTASTDRTVSLQKSSTTTSTNPAQHPSPPTYEEDSLIGQKRKRAARPAENAHVAKRQEIEELPPVPYTCYIPPPKPAAKARDVFVKVVKDTSSLAGDPRIFDDDDGHYVVVPDSDFTPRYKIVKLLGQGTFGKVVEGWDRETNTKCAVKVIRSVQKYRDASRIELRVLSTLKQNDGQNRNKCIHLRDCFDFRNHICIVTDLYGQSVFDFLKGNGFTPFPSSHIQIFAHQLLTSVAFLHDLNLIHTDLKPENILLVDNTYQTFTYNRTVPSSTTTQNRVARHRKVLLSPEIRLIDFGSATFNDEYHSTVVSTRHYRAPEIILNLGWSFPCDLWSVGCILVEFFTGDALFQTHENLEHLAMMEPVCDAKIDKDMVARIIAKDRSSKNIAASYFTRTKRLDYPNADTPRNSKKYVKAMKKLHEIIPPTSQFNIQFLDLLRKIFVYDPDKRITAKLALKHGWFKEVSRDDGSEAAKIREEQNRKRLGH